RQQDALHGLSLLVFDSEFVERGHVGQSRRAGRRGDRKPAQLAVLHQRGRGRNRLEAHRRVPSHDRLYRRTAARERRERKIQTEGELEQLAYSTAISLSCGNCAATLAIAAA